MYVCVCVQVLSSKDSALCEVTEQWQTSQLALGEREKELSQVSGQPVILYQVPHVHLWWSMSFECHVFDASLYCSCSMTQSRQAVVPWIPFLMHGPFLSWHVMTETIVLRQYSITLPTRPSCTIHSSIACLCLAGIRMHCTQRSCPLHATVSQFMIII